MTSCEVRANLVHALGLDLIGPDKGGDLQDEVLPQSPSRWYLTGFLVPLDAGESQKGDDTGNENVDEAGDSAGLEDHTPEPAAARRAPFPSSMGLSLHLPAAARQVRVVVAWGDYRRLEEGVAEVDESGKPASVRWQRTPRREEMSLPLPSAGPPVAHDVPHSDGLQVVLSVRPV